MMIMIMEKRQREREKKQFHYKIQKFNESTVDGNSDDHGQPQTYETNIFLSKKQWL